MDGTRADIPATLSGVTAAGTGYANTGDNVATTTTGSGTGLTVDFVASGGNVSSVSIDTLVLVTKSEM